MAFRKLEYVDKSDRYPVVDATRQVEASNLNEIKTKFNELVDGIGAIGTRTGYVIIPPDFDWQDIPPEYANCIWEIRDVHDIGYAEITLPINVTLYFTGGRIDKAASIDGNNTKIQAGMMQIFDAATVTGFTGTWIIDRVYPQWWGAIGDGIADDELAIQSALNFGGVVCLVDGTYNIGDISILKNKTHLILNNKAIIQSTKSFTTAIFVQGNDCIIEGGTLFMPPVFNVTNTEWTYASIHVSGTNTRIIGVTIDNVQKVGIGFKNTNNCYVRNCIINGNFSSYTGTSFGHYGIAYDPGGLGGTFVATNNTIQSCVNGIFVNNYGVSAEVPGILITGNIIKNCFKHAINCNGGEGQIINDNQLYYCGKAISTKCDRGAVVNDNMIYLGYEGIVLSDNVGIFLIDPVNVVCTGNNIIGNGENDDAVVVLTNVDEDIISGNIVSNNIIKLSVLAMTDAIQLGNNSLTLRLNNNIISNNIIESSCASFHGAIYSKVATDCECSNNIISNNTINLEVLSDTNAGIMIENSGGLIVKDNNIVLSGNANSEIDAYGIYSQSLLDYVGEIINNRISVYANNGDNINVIGVNVDQYSSRIINEVSWTINQAPVVGGNNYSSIERSLDEVDWTPVAFIPYPTATWRDEEPTLASGTTYYYRVRSFYQKNNDRGYSRYSNEAGNGTLPMPANPPAITVVDLRNANLPTEEIDIRLNHFFDNGEDFSEMLIDIRGNEPRSSASDTAVEGLSDTFSSIVIEDNMAAPSDVTAETEIFNTGTGILLVEGNKLDASDSDATSYTITQSTSPNAILKKNVNDLRIPSSGIATIATGETLVALPFGNWETYTPDDSILNIAIRPLNNAAITELETSTVSTLINIAAAYIVLSSAASADCVFAWEIN